MGTRENPGTFDCYANAEDDEPMFILLARDVTAPAVVRAWADTREARLRERWDDSATVGEVFAELDQIREARTIASEMEGWRDAHRS